MLKVDVRSKKGNFKGSIIINNVLEYLIGNAFVVSKWLVARVVLYPNCPSNQRVNSNENPHWYEEARSRH